MLTSLRLSESLRESLQTAAQRYHEAITSELALYLHDRGIDKDAAVGHLLGLVADPLPEHASYQGRLAIPYVTPAGVVGMRFRDLTGNSKAKYLGVEGAPARLYNTRALFSDKPYIAVCEGELDAIVLNDRVGVPATAVAGGHAWKDHMPRCFADFDRVFVICDDDVKEDGSNPGADFTKKIVGSLSAVGINAVAIKPPRGLDLSEWYVRDGARAIREKVLG